MGRPSVHTRLIGLILLLSLAAAPVIGVRAAVRGYYFSPVGREHGLRQNTVNAILQGPQGFIWVATQGGLHRFDGQRYVAFRHDPADAASLPDSDATALANGSDTELWIGTTSQYVARLDRRDASIRRYGPSTGVPAARQHVLALLPAPGRVWVGTRGGLEWLDPDSGARRLVMPLPDVVQPGAPSQSLAPAPAGGAWYGTASGLFHVDRAGHARRVGPAVAVRSLLVDAQRRLWVGRPDGLYRLDDAERLLRTWPRDAAAADIRAIAQAPDGALWLSAWAQGLVRLDPATGAVQRLRASDRIAAGLPEDAISALMVDRAGALWVGGQVRGVSVTDTRGARFDYLVDADTPLGAELSEDSVRAIAEGADGTLWVGTDGAHLLRYDAAAQLHDETALLPPGGPGGRPLRVLALASAGPGRLWLGAERGLWRLDTRARRLERIDLGRWNAMPVRALLPGPTGTLWLGSDGAGTLRLDTTDGSIEQVAYRASGNAGARLPLVHALLRDGHGRLWIGTSAGLDVFDPVSGRIAHFEHHPETPGGLSHNVIRALHRGADGRLWIGGHGGLDRVDEPPPGLPARLRVEHVLGGAQDSASVVYTIAEEPPGRLWLGTDNGIVRFDAGGGESRRYGLADGLQDLEFNGGAVARLRDGRLAFGGIRGLNLFDPAGVRERRYAPPVRLLAASTDGSAPDESPVLWPPQRLDVPASSELLRLRIGALDFSPSADLRYRYRLDGLDTAWVDNGPRPDISYTHLPPGRYAFRAQARNGEGPWSTDELVLPVEVAAPWWRLPGAHAALALALLGLAAVGLRQLIRRRRRERGYFEQIREREERLKLALWASGEQFWDYDLERRTLHRMRADESQGAAPEVGVQSLVEADHEIHPDDLPRVLEQLRLHLRGEAALFLSEHRIRSGPGRWAWVRARGRVVERDAAGRALRVAGTARDITASRSAERERRVSSEVLRSMVEAVAVVDRDFTFVSVNPAFARITGYADTEVIGRPLRVLDSAHHAADDYRQMRAELERNGQWSGELPLQRKDEGEFLCWLQASAVQEGSDAHAHYVLVLADITDKKRAEQELRYLANYDTLTSLPNRALLSERLSRAIVRARRQGTLIAVLFLDLDRFKDINDSLGHAAGDRILRSAAVRLQQTVGPEQTVARLGGDEFTVLLENLRRPEEAEDVARAIITAFGEPLEFDDRHDLAISPSIGIALYPEHAQVPTDLLKHADTAMYQAKALGRRTFMRYHGGMDIEIRRRATLSASLRKVIDRGELALVFQPRLSLATQRITGVEALLRWRSGEHGDVPPAQFIPLAEESGVILEIGEWVLHQACAMLHRWRQRGLLDLSMAVNVSALQLLRGDLPGLVARVLAETGMPAQCLELELTESVLMANAQETADTLQALRTLGVGLAIDDFGTGYSSLAYLKRLPITTLKIDKAFIGDITHDADDEAITTTVVAMGHSLGLTVVAEGVETEAQMHFLRERGCDEIQGYWLARPLEAAECVSFIRAWTPHLSGAPVD